MHADTLRTLEAGGRRYRYHSLEAAAERLGDPARLPFALKILAENLLRHLDGRSVTEDDVAAIGAWLASRRSEREIAFRPARVLMQDFTGVPAVADLAAMREAMAALGGDPARIEPLTPVDLVIDHSVMVDRWASPDAFEANVALEMQRNRERYAFLRWGQQAFGRLRVVPPGTGICHQVNLEHLAQVVWTEEAAGDDAPLAYPDTLVGTDSHTTMINGLGVLGWGVGGIEAEAAMLGQPVTMRIPEVVGVRLEGVLPEGATATDLVLTVTERLRAHGVVGKFVEFFGPGLAHLPLPDRATLANMAPEYGATCGLFPIDAETVRYLELTGRDPARIALVEAYARAQGMWRGDDGPEADYTEVVEIDLGAIEPSVAGPRRPQDRVPLGRAAAAFRMALTAMREGEAEAAETKSAAVEGVDWRLRDGDIVIAAITSCTNTSNPSVMLAAGLVARKAVERGLTTRPWVKTSLAPGSQVVVDYLESAGLVAPLEALGFHVVGFGCTTCIGNSGPLPQPVARAIEEGDLVACAVLSGNRNFEGRIHPLVRANYLASPPLVVAYALAGNMGVDLAREPLGEDRAGNPVYLRDLWPSAAEVAEAVRRHVGPKAFRRRYADVFRGPEAWRAIEVPEGVLYRWDPRSTYIRRPPFLEGVGREPPPVDDILGARALAILGDSVTTDHISPAGAIKPDSPAGRYLVAHGVEPREFNSFGSRRGNHEVMIRGTFGNIRLQNEMVPGRRGGFTRHMPDGAEMSIYDAAMAYAEEGVPLVVIAGREYGTGSSRDWAAKGTRLLGVRAVIAESFERIHRSNLVGMGVLPLEFPEGVDRRSLGLDGSETYDIRGIAQGLAPRARLEVTVHPRRGRPRTFEALCRIDTEDELAYYRHGGILPYVLRRLLD
ncbi:aconitate hydratase AcnA [Inmirania thermothiophila]|uniref:Aconitate hydratase n=1 Tax=Inmirania thermothiophila TaxID=1750597 RepID=A0A3N1Y215_9GAMM|nr:aconitate hydratase AcnA [Inmirania thermothiophila]ROR32864.1 aconitase [Inmirania thermothiophila]